MDAVSCEAEVCVGAGCPHSAPHVNSPPLPVFCRGSASSPCSPVCWRSATCTRWETGTDDVLGTPSRPGSLAPRSCSGRRREREDAFALSIVPALCPLSGGCRTCGLWEMTEATIVTLPILAAEHKDKSYSLGPGPSRTLASADMSTGDLKGKKERKTGKLPFCEEVSVQAATGKTCKFKDAITLFFHLR